tara:strand:+ start:692 stop:1096 length:405 start_codon:yes stop_codon:yes gene_type:complete
MKVKVPTKVTVLETTDKGRGIFAITKIKKGEVVEACPVVPYEELTKDVSDWSPTETIMQIYHNWGPWGPAGHPDTCMVLGYGAMYNHSDEPNLIIEKDLVNSTISFTALRDIESGEECCHQYLMWSEDLRGKKI